MEWLSSVFLNTFIFCFSLLFPLFKHPVLSTYVVLLILFVAAVWFNYRYIKRNNGSKKSGRKMWVFVGAVVAEVYLVGFLLWYIVIHFHTYQLLK